VQEPQVGHYLLAARAISFGLQITICNLCGVGVKIAETHSGKAYSSLPQILVSFLGAEIE
jgi:hypothetical protein